MYCTMGELVSQVGLLQNLNPKVLRTYLRTDRRSETGVGAGDACASKILYSKSQTLMLTNSDFEVNVAMMA